MMKVNVNMTPTLTIIVETFESDKKYFGQTDPLTIWHRLPLYYITLGNTVFFLGINNLYNRMVVHVYFYRIAVYKCTYTCLVIGLWCLTPLSTVFQSVLLGGNRITQRKPVGSH